MKHSESKTIYKFRDGTRVTGVEPEIAAKELDRICKNKGAIKPSDVLEEAESIDSPIHNVFNWDDKSAAHEYRLQQARILIRSIEVQYEDTTPHTMYVHVTTEFDDGCYLPATVVVQSHDMFESAIGQLVGKLESSQRSVKELRDLAIASGRNKARVKKVEVVSSHLEAASAAAKAIV